MTPVAVPHSPWSVTGIGSLPHRSAGEAVEFMRRTADLPYLPQLPRVSPSELMDRQLAAALPDGEVPHLCTEAMPGRCTTLKLQIAGPATADFLRVPYRNWRRTAEWFRRRFSLDSPIVQLDEPALPDHPSAARQVAEAVLELKEAGAAVWLHCCATAPPPGFWLAPADVLSFDSSLARPTKEAVAALGRLLERGGWIAWGAVPTHGRRSPERCLAELDGWLKALGEYGELARRRSLVTPACGLAFRSPETAGRVMETCRVVAQSFAIGKAASTAM